MINLLNLNKLVHFIFFLSILIFNFTISFAAVDIWKKNEEKDNKNNQNSNEQEIKIGMSIINGQDDAKLINFCHLIFGLNEFIYIH